MLKELILSATQQKHITVVQAQKLATYTHQTYFRHLRLYDFVLKNAQLTSEKRINISTAEPNPGQSISQAIVLEDEVSLIWYEPEEEEVIFMKKNSSSLLVPETVEEEPSSKEATQSAFFVSSPTDSDMESREIPKEHKKIIHRSMVKWQ